MLDSMKNLANLPQLLAKAREAQQKVQELQAEMAARRITADAGAGVVEATVDGRMVLVGLKIDAERLGTGQLGGPDVAMLEEIIVQAVNAAQTKAQEEVRREMAKLAGDAGLPPDMLAGTPAN